MESPIAGGLVTPEETMSVLRVSRSTVYRLVYRKELLAYKIASRWLFDRNALKEFIAYQRFDVQRARGNQAHVEAQRDQGEPVFAACTNQEGR